MKRAIFGSILMTCAVWFSFGQSAEPLPKFDAADVQVSAKNTNPNQFMRTGPVRNGRYEVKTATMVDLIRTAYGYDTDKILGGPNWLEMDRFDVIGKVPADSTPETQKQMLQAVLEDRFQLKLHKDTRPLPVYALTVGKQHKLKEASGSEETGCKPQSGPAGGEGTIRLMMGNANGGTTQLNLGPGMTVLYSCRNMTMEAFASNLRSMIGAFNNNLNSIKDETGLKGAWNFDVKYSMTLIGPMMQNNAERITIFDAVDKQLGLKLEERPVPTPVLVVDSVSRKPAENPADVKEALPELPMPTEFEVASIKPVEGPMGPGGRMMRAQMQPGGRYVVEGMPLRFLISRAFNTNNNDQIVGLPAFVDTDRYDINAKTPSGGPQITNMDIDSLAPLILSLLKERFKLAYHTEERPITAYALAAGKPKMKKADPNSRTYCRNGNAPPGSAPGSRAMTCQNITMEQFAEKLQSAARELTWPVQDATKLEGGYDFTLVFSMGMPMMMARGGGGGGEGGPAGAGLPSAAEPMDNLTIFEAVEKQLGLKLEKQKRSMPVIVVDHIEQKPTDN